MVVDCSVCVDGIMNGGGACTICGGDGEIDLTDSSFKFVRASYKRTLEGIVWDSILTSLADIKTKLDTLDSQHDVLESQHDALEVKIDALE